MTQDLVQAQPDKQAGGLLETSRIYKHNFQNIIGLMPHVLVHCIMPCWSNTQLVYSALMV